MKKILFFALFTVSQISAQEISAQETGSSAAIAAEASQNSWKNWIFAASVLVTATTGVVLISLSSGTHAH